MVVVEITVVQFKQLRTTTPRKKRNERYIYTLQQINTTNLVFCVYFTYFVQFVQSLSLSLSLLELPLLDEDDEEDDDDLTTPHFPPTIFNCCVDSKRCSMLQCVVSPTCPPKSHNKLKVCCTFMAFTLTSTWDGC